MKEKARRNLDATRILLAAACVDPAMSRLYYALFQATVYHFECRGVRPSELGPYTQWKHSTARNHVYRIRQRNEDVVLLRLAYTLRSQADYAAEPVDGMTVAKLVFRAEDFVREACR
jgi:uncharacterized protein (UPF0332 family)